MPVCYCIVILIIAMIIKMVMVMINMMVITYRPLVGLEAPTQQYAVPHPLKSLSVCSGK